MASPFALPTPAEVAARTPADRDRVVDVIRIAALVGVVAGHTVMATSIISGAVFTWDNLLTTSVLFQALTWLLQVMPLFFFAGAAACVRSWRPAEKPWGSWLMTRCTRLFRPVFYYLGFWAVALPVLHHVLPPHVYDPIAGISIQLLWFVGAYVLMLAAMPALVLVTSPYRLLGGVAGVYAVVAVVDAVRLAVPGTSALGYLNIVVWLIPGMFGVAYHRGLLHVRAALVTAASVLAANVALTTAGPYEVSLVGIGGQRLANMTPPSLLLAGHAIVLCCLAIAAAPAIGRWALRPRVWWLAAIGNSGAMTLYLWHMPALLGIHLAFDHLGWPRYPGQPHFVALGVAQALLMTVLTGLLFLTLRPLENRPLPGWDGATVTRGARDAAVGLLLCVAGLATLVSVKWGLKDQGLHCVGVMLAALVTARLLATESTRAPNPSERSR